jgi:hypothetical protein
MVLELKMRRWRRECWKFVYMVWSLLLIMGHRSKMRTMKELYPPAVSGLTSYFSLILR